MVRRVVPTVAVAPLFPDQVTYEATLNTLDYLQPGRTRPWQCELYGQVRKFVDYDCEQNDIDSTVVELRESSAGCGGSSGTASPG